MTNRRRHLLLVSCLLVLVAPAAAFGQGTTLLQIRVTHAGTPVAGAEVMVGAAKLLTDAAGLVSVALPAGAATVLVHKDGYVPAAVDVDIKAGGVPQSLAIALEKLPEVRDDVTVSATRTGGRIDDIPMRVEALKREEIEEKMLMTPGDIVMMLNEMGGMRVQTTSPGLGAATVRMQGMRGRQTRFFSDGLPLFGEVGGIGLLQIPPMDLGQVEVIKGVASSLYGAGAMAGVVNLVSRQPGEATEYEALFNQSSRGATDVVGWYSTPAKTGWALTLLGGGHFQSANDVDGDQWADLAGYSRGVTRPRVSWNDGKGNTFFGTVGFTGETRTGGTVVGGVVPDGNPYVEALETRRIDGGFVGQMLVKSKYLVSARAAFSDARNEHQFGEVIERDVHGTTFAEGTMRTAVSKHTVVVGAALERDAYRAKDVPQFDFEYWVPGVFAQADLNLAQWVVVSGSARLDHHSEYGTFLSPRVSALFRSGGWTSRVSMGTGFFGSSPLTEETEAAGLSRLAIPVALKAERGQSASIDVTRRHGPFTATFTLFGSRVKDPLYTDRSTGLVLTNLAQATTTAGVEVIGTYREEPFSLTGTYAFVNTREFASATAQEVALTPRHSAGLVGMWEREGRGRLGVELYYTGAQRLDENPYATTSQPYLIFGMLGEYQLGKFRFFINGENLTGVRQTKSNPLVRPTRAPDGRWTVDAWAPLDGRNINGGVRVRF